MIFFKIKPPRSKLRGIPGTVIKLVVKETAEVERIKSPVTVGVLLPDGLLASADELSLWGGFKKG